MEKTNSTINSSLLQYFSFGDRKSRMRFVLFTILYSVFIAGVIFFCLSLLKSVGIGKGSTGYEMISWSLLLFLMMVPYSLFRHEKARA